jgi:thioester reductase-like protein
VLERDPASRATCLVQCLVQRKYAQAAAARLELIGLASPAVADRIRLVEGDVSRADLGLGGKIEELLESTSEIWHLAAVYDLSVARDAALRVNVEGTQNVLELARHCSGLERLQYVSTCYVSGRYAGIFREEDLEKGQAFNNPYEETKYLAELSVRAAMGEGLPVTVYRPSIVVGDSRTGETQKYDGPYVIIRWVLRQPGTALVPVVGDPDATRVNLVPRDFVIDAISHLSGLPHSVGRTYQLADPQPPNRERYGKATAAHALATAGREMGDRQGARRAPADRDPGRRGRLLRASDPLHHVPGADRPRGERTSGSRLRFLRGPSRSLRARPSGSRRGRHGLTYSGGQTSSGIGAC